MFEKLILNPYVKNALKQYMDKGQKNAQHLILSGPQGTGKRTCADILAHFLLDIRLDKPLHSCADFFCLDCDQASIKLSDTEDLREFISYIHATKDLNTGESGLAGKLKSLEDQMFRLSAELKSIKSVGFSKPVDTALEAETNIPITSNSSAQPDLPEESVPVLITPSKTSEVAQTETTDFDALFGDWGFDSFDNTDEPGFFESAEETGTSFQETATVSETSAALSAGELAQKSLSERISNDPVIKEKLLSAEWITQEENLLLKVLPEYKEDILLFIAASGIKNITIC